MAGTLPGQVLQLRLENGASVADWLGTAGVAARMAANHIEAIRDERVANTEMTLQQAEAELRQALAEVVVVHEALAERERQLKRMFESDRRLVADMEADGLL